MVHVMRELSPLLGFLSRDLGAELGGVKRQGGGIAASTCCLVTRSERAGGGSRSAASEALAAGSGAISAPRWSTQELSAVARWSCLSVWVLTASSRARFVSLHDLCLCSISSNSDSRILDRKRGLPRPIFCSDASQRQKSVANAISSAVRCSQGGAEVDSPGCSDSSQSVACAVAASGSGAAASAGSANGASSRRSPAVGVGCAPGVGKERALGVGAVKEPNGPASAESSRCRMRATSSMRML